MTFSITVPNATQSPGLFPAQNNTNFLRLKDIINNDHNFTDASSASQGIHKQSTYINRATPVGLPAGNCILYSKLDAYGATQLNLYNNNDYPMTMGMQLIGSGSITLTTASNSVMFTVPASSFGYIYMWEPTSSGAASYTLWSSDGTRVTAQQVLTSLGITASPLRMPIQFQSVSSYELKPLTTSATFNGTYQYRVYQVV